MKKKKVCVCGHFGFSEELYNGQTIKTKVLSEELELILGTEEVSRLDTFGGWKAFFRIFFSMPSVLHQFKNLIILPAHRGVFIITPIIAFWRLFFHHSKVHYAVIGAWLPEYMHKHPLLRFFIRHSVDYIYAETDFMKQRIQDLGFANTFVMHNFKNLVIINASEMKKEWEKPFPVCIFSRIMRQKGISDAVNAIKEINEEAGRLIYKLDIYGPVLPTEKDWFEKEMKDFTPAIKYQGVIEFNKSVNTVKQYFLLLFPTHFKTEGIPGSIIDAYAAGVPVLAARWENFNEIVEEGVTGFGYEMGKTGELKQKLLELADNPEKVILIKTNCLEKIKSFAPSAAISKLISHLS